MCHLSKINRILINSYLSSENAEFIKFKNKISLNTQTVYFYESTYSESFSQKWKQYFQILLKEMEIGLVESAIMMKNIYLKMELELVRLKIIDAVTNLIINNKIGIYQKDFDKNSLKSF